MSKIKQTAGKDALGDLRQNLPILMMIFSLEKIGITKILT